MCPHPPLLVPAVAAGAAAELADLRRACAEAIDTLLGAEPDLVCVIGSGATERWYGDGDSGTLRPYGVALDVPLAGRPSRSPALPLSLTIGSWLVQQSRWSGPRTALAVPAGTSDASLDRLSAEVTDAAGSVALLVMGDGTARRSVRAPGYLDPRAAAFDDAVIAALADADTDRLARLDPQLGAELLAAGTTPWRFLGRAGSGAQWAGSVLYADAPYGVTYCAAAWARK